MELDDNVFSMPLSWDNHKGLQAAATGTMDSWAAMTTGHRLRAKVFRFIARDKSLHASQKANETPRLYVIVGWCEDGGIAVAAFPKLRWSQFHLILALCSRNSICPYIPALTLLVQQKFRSNPKRVQYGPSQINVDLNIDFRQHRHTNWQDCSMSTAAREVMPRGVFS